MKSVRYQVEKEGRAIIGFDLIWSNDTTQKSATQKQIKELKTTVDRIIDDWVDLVNINDEADRESAIRIVKETRDMIPMTQESICITYERADLLIQQANWNIKELHRLSKKKDSVYYNWLEE